MAMTFGEYLITRRIYRNTANPALIRRIQAAPRLADVTNFDELAEILGSFTTSEEFGIKSYWRSYRSQQQAQDRQITRRRA